MKGDLHCHTTHSDGSAEAEWVVGLAARSGLDAVSLTDHDTMASFPETERLGEKFGIRVIRGVELSSFDNTRGRKAHILCYLPKRPEKLEALCRNADSSRKRVGREMIRLVMERYPITEGSVMRYAGPDGVIYKQHIMHALMDSGYETSIYGDLFQKLFGRGGSCLVRYPYPDVYDVLSAVREAEGIAVLAHPSVYRSMELFEELAQKDLLDGVEAFHPRNREEDIAVCLDTAERKGLLVTGGSDFHGMYSANADSFVGSRTTGGEDMKKLLLRAEQ